MLYYDPSESHIAREETCPHCLKTWTYDDSTGEWSCISNFGSEMTTTYDPFGHNCCMACVEELYTGEDLVAFVREVDKIGHALDHDHVRVRDSLTAQVVLALAGFEKPEEIEQPLESWYFKVSFDDAAGHDPRGLWDAIQDTLDYNDGKHDGSIGWEEFNYWYVNKT